jgi:hypothetical protein
LQDDACDRDSTVQDLGSAERDKLTDGIWSKTVATRFVARESRLVEEHYASGGSELQVPDRSC